MSRPKIPLYEFKCSCCMGSGKIPVQWWDPEYRMARYYGRTCRRCRGRGTMRSTRPEPQLDAR